MKLIKTTFLYFLPLFWSLNVVSQTQFNMIGGQQFDANIVSEDEENIVYEITKKNKSKQKTMPKERLFSTITNGKETIHYRPDMGYYNYNVNDMRYYVYGQQDAYQYYKTPIAVIVSGAVGAAAGFWMGTEESGLVVLSPLVGTIAGTLSQKHKPDPSKTRSKSYLKEPAYVLGYEKSARSKKVFNAIKGALVGSMVGATLGFATAN